GRVTRNAISRVAASRSRTSAPSDAVAATPIVTGSPEDDARPQRRERLLAVLVVGPVDDQHAVEVVQLVLDDARSVRLELDAQVIAVRVLALEHDTRGALDGHAHALEREAALLLGRRLLAALDDDGVDDRARPLLVRLEHEQPPEDADLGRREADPLRVVH